MTLRVRNPFAAFGIACLCLALAFLVRWAVTPLMGNTAPYMLFILAAILAAVFGGLWPGLAAAVAGQFVAHYYFSAEKYTWYPEEFRGWVYWAMYDLVALVCVGLVGMLHRATHQAEENRDRAQRQEEQLRTIIREMSATQERIRYLAEVVESADDAIISTTTSGKVVSWNRGAERLLGFKAAEMVGQPLSRVVPERLRHDYVSLLARVVAGESTAPTESVRLSQDGQTINVSISLSPLRDEAGKVTGVSAILRDISEAKQAEAEIKRLNDDLKAHLDETRQIMEVLPAGVAIAVGPGCEKIEVNRTLASMLGLTTDDFIPDGDKLPNALVVRDPEKVLKFLPLQLAASRDRELSGWEASLERAEGPEIQLLGQAVPLHDGNGQVRGVVGAFIDVTELKRAHAALQETEQRFRAMADKAPLMIWMTDAEHQSTWVNKTWRTFTGREQELETVQGWAEPIHSEDRPTWERALEEATQGRQSFELEYRLMRADGEVRWVLDRGVPRFGSHGEFLGYIGSCIDVTEWKQAEMALEKKFDELRDAQHALRAQNEVLARNRRELEHERGRYREFFNSAPIGYVITSRQGVIEQVNIAAAELLRESPQFLEGFPFARLLAKHDRAAFFSTIGRLTRGEVSQITGWEVTVEPHGAEPFPCSITVNLVSDDENRPIGLRWILRDVTERREAEQRILKLNSELEQRVRERTAALEAANRELEAFSYSVSHDLRAPLRGINGFCKALLEDYTGKLDEQGVKYLTHAYQASVRMNHLIEDLLELSRVARGKLQLQDVDVTALAEAIIAELQNREPERKVQFVVHPQLTASADLGLLRIALENLIGNAWKFTSGRANARVEIGGMQKNGHPCIYVRDNGAGFDMANSARLFGVFQRLHTQEEFPGTGIGLATVKRIVNRHGGDAWAEGKPGDGATFYFTLPHLPPDPEFQAHSKAVSQQPPSAAQPAAVPDSNQGPKRAKRRAKASPGSSQTPLVIAVHSHTRPN